MDIQLVAQTRTQSGKGAARRLRQQERVPAICYGCKKEPVALSVGRKQFQKLLQEIGLEARVIPLSLEGVDATEVKHVMVRDLQLNPCNHAILHVDFLEVDMAQPIVVEVPILLKGIAAGIAEGGMGNQIRHAISVRCLPGDIPDRIDVDISALNVGDSLHVADIKARIKAEVIDEDHYTLVTVGAPAAAAAVSKEEETITEGEEVTAEGR